MMWLLRAALLLVCPVLWAHAGDGGSYVGCFKDSQTAPDLPHSERVSGTVTVDACVTKCRQSYYRYAGLQNASLCFCGSSYGNYGPSTCSLKCKELECGDAGANSVYETGMNVPGPVAELFQVQNGPDADGIQIRWLAPAAPNGAITGYKVTAQPVFTYGGGEGSVPTLEWSFANETGRGDLVGVRPGTKYNVTVYSKNEAGMGIGAYKLLWSAIGEPEVPTAPEIIRVENGLIVVRLSPVTPRNGPISAYRIIVINEETPKQLDESQLKSHADAETEGIPFYIAAEFAPEDFPREFTVGDGRQYGKYDNPALPAGKDFHVTLQVISQQDGVTKTSFAYVSHEQHSKGVVYLGPPRTEDHDSSSTSDEHETTIIVGSDPMLILGLSVAIGVFGFLLLASVIVYVCLRLHYGRRKRRQGSENQELTVQGPMVEIEDNGYVHTGLVLGDEEGPVDHYDRLRSQVTTLPRGSLVMEQVLGRGQFGPVLRGTLTVQRGGGHTEVALYDVPDTVEDKQGVLHDLDTLVRVGFHGNIVTLLGICEEPDHLYVVTEHHPASLKDMLVESRYESHGRFCTLDEAALLDIARGIAMAMDYLSSLRVVHNFLQCRSVLMADGSTPKVTGFGLAQYRRSGEGVRDLTRWTSQEVFRSRLNTSAKSDAWSFGVLLWEIAALGGTPYAEVKTKDVPMRVTRGLRPEQLAYVGDDLYQLMLQCWQIDPDERPTFSEVASVLENLCLESAVHLNFGMFPGFQYERYDPQLEMY